MSNLNAEARFVCSGKHFMGGGGCVKRDVSFIIAIILSIGTWAGMNTGTNCVLMIISCTIS